MSLKDRSRIVVTHALAVRVTGAGVGFMASGAWCIVAEADDPDELRKKASAMTDYLSSTRSDAVVLRVEHHPFSQRTKVVPVAKYLASGWSGLWQDNFVPQPLTREQQGSFDRVVESFMEEREAKAAAIRAAARKRREVAVAKEKRQQIAIVVALVSFLAAGLTYFALPSPNREGASLTAFERSGGYFVILPDGDGATHQKWKIWPDGTRALVGRGPLHTLKRD